MAIRKAKRQAVPLLISLSSVSGGGKTFSALLMAAGLANGGKVGFLDTENGRGSMYADEAEIMAAFPDGYLIDDMIAPFSPKRYIEAIEAFEREGVKVLVIDSGTHEWEGFGGCQDIAHNNKISTEPNWNLSKTEHKRLMNRLLAASTTIITCLRAREKVKYVKVGGKTQVIPLGLTPICEKNFIYEMMISLLLDEKTHHAQVLKAPKALAHLFPGNKMITVADGEAIRKWNERGQSVNPQEALEKRQQHAAAEGMGAYQLFWQNITAEERVALKHRHEAMKQMAQEFDAEVERAKTDPGMAPEYDMGAEQAEPQLSDEDKRLAEEYLVGLKKEMEKQQ
jgi:hypothetical protein